MKILHIGNIANNAYYNAEILNKSGNTNHVIAYDYYHVMGLPEWNDTSFNENFGDSYFPDYWKIKKKKFWKTSLVYSRPLKRMFKLLLCYSKRRI